MNAFTRSDAGIGSGRSERFHRWRTIQDQLFRRLITLGGISVIVAVVLILFYLIYVVFPLFLAPESDRFDLGENAQWQSSPAMYSAVEEQLELGLRIERSGAAEFFSLDGLNTVSQKSLVGEEQEIALVAEANQGNGSIAIFSSTGQMGVLRHSYETSFAQGVENRQIIPKLEYPYGEGLRDLTAGIAPSQAAVSDGDNGLLVAAVAERTLFVEISDKRENFLTGETTLDTRNISADLDFDATGLAISNNHRWIYVSNDIGQVQVLNAGTLEPIQTLKVSDHPITTITMLLGGISVLAGDESGTISQMFPVRDDSNQTELKLIRRFDGLSEPVVKILPEYRRKGFVAYDQAGNIGVYHSTAGQQVLFVPATSGVPSTAAVSPRANGLMQIRGARVEMLMLENEHPEVSLASLWKKVWYENYTEPQYIWQSSAASNEFEPKFSLTPLAFGTLKAALFAMLFAVPLSLMGPTQPISWPRIFAKSSSLPLKSWRRCPL